MNYTTMHLNEIPALNSPTMIIGLRGWGNALEVSAGMAAYLVGQNQNRRIGRIHSDTCYRYDENRPVAKLENGELKSIHIPGGSLYAVQHTSDHKDMLILIADEPSLNWHRFAGELVDLAINMGATAVFTMGSMFDHVLHTDRIISVATTGLDDSRIERDFGVTPINYHGPSAIHTVILDACRKRGMPGASFWCHCPAYLQGITHYGLMIQLSRILSDVIPVSIQTDSLQAQWEDLELEIQQLIDENPKIEAIMDEIRKKKRAGAWENLRQNGNGQGNVISLEEFRS